MATSKTSRSSTAALVGLWTLSLTAFVIAAFYFAREILIPLALATLFTFLLAPVVSAIERRLGRVFAVLLTTLLILAAIGSITWVLSRQFVDLAVKLPSYQQTIYARLHSLHLPIGDAPAAPAPTPAADPNKPAQAAPPPDILHTSPTALAQMLMASLLSPIGNAALVALLVIFMLLNREDLRSRFVRIIGQGRISITTRAMDDAGHRVSRYLLLLLAVNLSFGLIIGVGLALIGLPNAVLWGSLAALFRFIPYIGCWIAAALPLALSLAVSPSWTAPILVLALFAIVEVLNANFLEPWLYGTHTGVSPFALIVAAIFWAWLWGPIGLLLSTPLTVCLVVMGRHVPRLAFLSIMLSDEEALSPAEECYRRLLSVGLNEASEFVDAFLKTHPLVELYDTVLIPVVAVAEIDRRRESLDEEQLLTVEQGIRDIVDDLGTRPTSLPPASVTATDPTVDDAIEPTPEEKARKSAFRIHCLPARASRDDLASVMLAQLLHRQGFTPLVAPSGPNEIERTIAFIREARIDLVCIAVVPPSTVIHARFLCAKLIEQFPDLKIVVTLWGSTSNLSEASERLYASGAAQVATTLDGTVQLVNELTAPPVTAENTVDSVIPALT